MGLYDKITGAVQGVREQRLERKTQDKDKGLPKRVTDIYAAREEVISERDNSAKRYGPIVFLERDGAEFRYSDGEVSVLDEKMQLIVKQKRDRNLKLTTMIDVCVAADARTDGNGKPVNLPPGAFKANNNRYYQPGGLFEIEGESLVVAPKERYVWSQVDREVSGKLADDPEFTQQVMKRIDSCIEMAPHAMEAIHVREQNSIQREKDSVRFNKEIADYRYREIKGMLSDSPGSLDKQNLSDEQTPRPGDISH